MNQLNSQSRDDAAYNRATAIRIFTGVILISIVSFLPFLHKLLIRDELNFWFLSGIYLAVLLLIPTRRWAWMVVAVFLISLSSRFLFGQSQPALYISSTLDTFTGFAAAWIFRQFSPSFESFRKLREILVLGLSAGLSSAISGLFLLLLPSVTAGIPLFSLFQNWWLGQTLGMFIVTPFLVNLLQESATDLSRLTRGKRIEGGILLLSILLLSIEVFSPNPMFISSGVLTPFVLFPFLVWAAVNFKFLGTSNCLFIILLIANILVVPAFSATRQSSMAFLDFGFLMTSLVFQILASVLTQQGEAEAKARSMARLNHLLSKLNHSFVRTRENFTLFREVCRTMVNDGDFRLVWIGMLDEDATRIRPIAREYNKHGLQAGETGTLPDPPDIEVEETRLLLGGRPSIQNHIKEGRFTVANREIGSRAVFPITTGKKLFGALVLCDDQADLFGEDEIGLLLELTDDIAFAIESIQRSDQQKEQELSTRELRDLLLATIESAGEGILVVNRSGAVSHMNSRFIEMWGLPRQFLGTIDEHALDDFIVIQVLKSHWFLSRLKELHQSELESLEMVELKDGRVFEWVSAPLFREGTDAGRVHIYRDITERMRTDNLIREQVALLEAAHDAICVMDINHTIRYWNRGSERLTGWNRELVIGKNADEIVFAYESRRQASEAHRRTIEDGEWNGELVLINRDTSELPCESRWSLLRDKQGNPSSILLLNTDATERKRLEAQVLRAQRLESLGTLAGGIAHDLNNVLSPILMSVELMQSYLTDDRTRRTLNSMQTSVLRGTDIIKQVLTFARGLKGERMLLQPKHLLREIDQLIRETFPKTIRIRSVIPRDLWPINGEATQLHQVVLNLCVNARDAMPGGGILEVNAINIPPSVETEPSRVMIEVRDTGTGIPEAILPKIFDPFFSTKEPGLGTGLGLATSKMIIENHGGFITVDSRLGQGTSFRVYLPAESGSEAAALEESIDELPRGSGELILVVDDEVSIRELIKETLEAYGYEVITAGDGTAAIAVYASHIADIKVVITDIMMPQLDGPSMIRAMKAIKSDAAFIVISGLASAEQNLKLGTEGVFSFISKPFTAEKIIKSVADSLH